MMDEELLANILKKITHEEGVATSKDVARIDERLANHKKLSDLNGRMQEMERRMDGATQSPSRPPRKSTGGSPSTTIGGGVGREGWKPRLVHVPGFAEVPQRGSPRGAPARMTRHADGLGLRTRPVGLTLEIELEAQRVAILLLQRITTRRARTHVDTQAAGELDGELHIIGNREKGIQARS